MFLLFLVYLDVCDSIYTEHVNYEQEFESYDKLNRTLSLVLKTLIKIATVL